MATKTNKLLWAILCVSQLIYIQVAYSMGPSESTSEAADQIFPALLFIALALAVGTIYCRKRALVTPIASGQINLETTQGLAKAFTPFILNLVLSQAVGIYGLVLSFMSGEPLYTVGFVAASLTLMYIHRPTSAELQAQPPSTQRGVDSSPLG